MSKVGLWKYLKNFEKHSTSYKLTEWLLRLVKLISEMSLPKPSKTKLKLSATKKALKTAQPHFFSRFHFNDLGLKTVLLLWSLAHLSQFHCQDRGFGFQSSFCKQYLYLLFDASLLSLSQYLLWNGVEIDPCTKNSNWGADLTLQGSDLDPNIRSPLPSSPYPASRRVQPWVHLRGEQPSPKILDFLLVIFLVNVINLVLVFVLVLDLVFVLFLDIVLDIALDLVFDLAL